MNKTLIKVRQLGRRSVVFDYIRQNNGLLSRFDICKATGFSTTTINSIVDGLISDGLVSEDKSQQSRVGRRPSLLYIQRDGIYFAGIECNATGINLTISDATLDIVYDENAPLDSPKTIDIMTALQNLLNNFIQKSPEIWSKIPSVVFSIPGKIDTKAGVAIQYRTIPDWHNVDFRSAFSYLGKKLIFVNNVDAMLTGYRIQNKISPDKSVMFIVIRNSAGVRLFSKGKLCSELGIVCEIGHMKAGGSTRWCACGKKGCFDAEVSATTIVGKLREAYYTGLIEESAIKSEKGITLETFFQLIRRKDPTALQILSETIGYISQMMDILLSFFQPDIIILSSFFHELDGYLSPVLNQFLFDRAELDKTPEMISIPLVNNLASYGATIIGYEDIFSLHINEI